MEHDTRKGGGNIHQLQGSSQSGTEERNQEIFWMQTYQIKIGSTDINGKVTMVTP